jgi:hypothetical protein
MKVKCIDTHTPRSDGRKGQPQGIKVGGVYDVAEILPQSSQYSIMNDDSKMSRYNQFRFEVVDDSPVMPLRQAFNSLTTSMRVRIRELEIKAKEMSTDLEFENLRLRAVVENLTNKLRPYLKEEFEEGRVKFIAKTLYPQRRYMGQKPAEFRDPHAHASVMFHGVSHFCSEICSDGLFDLTVEYQCGDCTELYTQYFPKAWIDYDNQISNDDLYQLMWEWCNAETIKIEAEYEAKRIKNLRTKEKEIKELEERLSKLKAE